MNYVTVMGVEGCGHHLVYDLWDGAGLRSIGAYEAGERDWEGPVMVRHSYPHQNPRDALRRMNIPEMFDIYPGIKCLWLHRSPVACVLSALRRGFTQDALLQCRIVEDNLIYLHRYRAGPNMAYEEILANPRFTVGQISAHFGVGLNPDLVGKPTQFDHHPEVIQRVRSFFLHPVRVQKLRQACCVYP